MDFFDKWNAYDSACTDLTAGLSWTMAVPTAETSDYLRRRVIRFQPMCSAALYAESDGTGGVSDDATDSIADQAMSGCQAPECIVFQSRPSPPSEPDVIFPEDVE